MSHEDVARRLRDQGMAAAPPDLRDEVMRAVRAEPQPQPAGRRRLPRPALPAWRPVAVWVGVAACLLAAGVGISRLGGPGSSSSSADSSAAGHLADRGLGAGVGSPFGKTTLLFGSAEQARAVLGVAAYEALHRSADGTLQSVVAPSEYYSITRRYANLPDAKASALDAPGTRIRVLLRVRAP